jgi:hypothetical protein
MSKQYLYRINILNRKNSHPLEAISYYSGENQFDMNNSKKYVSNSADNVIWNHIIVPNKDDDLEKYKHLPEFLKFRSAKKDIISNARNILWQNIYLREKRDDAQFARLFEIAIPSFLDIQQASETLVKFAKILVEQGMIADCAIHSRQKNNYFSLLDNIKNQNQPEKENTEKEQNGDYRGFLMCTLRDYENGQFVNKNRDWNNIKLMEIWRKEWVTILADVVDNSVIDFQEKKSWYEKLSIYKEYNEIKMKKENSNKINNPAKISLSI